jgi:hypothetical protein
VLAHHSTVPTYFIVPIVCLYAACVWMLAQRNAVLRGIGATVLVLAFVFAIRNDWREVPIHDSNFPASVRAYQAAVPGTTVHVPISPEPWAIDLVKRKAEP